MNLPKSVLTKSQKRIFEKIKGSEKIVVTIRYDDQCGNGHNPFSITGSLYEKRRWDRYEFVSGGQIQEDIARFFPELVKYFKWHLCSSDGPMHYVANTVYHAADKDCWGLRKGESRQLKNGKSGLPAWHLTALDREGNQLAISEIEKYVDSETQPECIYILGYVPWLRIGEGKEPDLEAARSCAVWPDATLEQLQDEKALLVRLPGLMEEFKAAVEELGFTY